MNVFFYSNHGLESVESSAAREWSVMLLREKCVDTLSFTPCKSCSLGKRATWCLTSIQALEEVVRLALELDQERREKDLYSAAGAGATVSDSEATLQRRSSGSGDEFRQGRSGASAFWSDGEPDPNSTPKAASEDDDDDVFRSGLPDGKI